MQAVAEHADAMLKEKTCLASSDFIEKVSNKIWDWVRIRWFNTFLTLHIVALYVVFDVTYYSEPPDGIRLNVSMNKETEGGEADIFTPDDCAHRFSQ